MGENGCSTQAITKLLFLSCRIRLRGLFPFRSFCEAMNLVDSQYNTLDGGSARRKAATYTGLYKHGINAEIRSCLGWDSNPRSQCFERTKTFSVLDRSATVIGYN
jgi:hypothetical protein